MNLRVTAFTACLLTACVTGGALADFREGLKFFQSGNHAQAALVWQQSAEAGVPASQRNLGLLYLNGLGVPKNPTEAARWFKAAADQSFAPAAANMANLYLRGIGIATDRRKAAEYMRIAAEGGLAESQHNLAVFYEHGVGLDKDEDAAVFWYRRAAGQGFGKSADRLAALRPDAKPEPVQTAEPEKATEPAQLTGRRTARIDPGDGLVDRLIPLFSADE
jgi:TPR repeat protein